MKIKLDENLPFGLAILLRSLGHENIAEWAGCFVAATERKIRLLKPPHNPSWVSPREPR
jgi:hypothetical protein